MGLNPNWVSTNETQERFIRHFLAACKGVSLKEIELSVSQNANEINEFLASKGFSIRLNPFPPNTVGFASILDLLVQWLQRGKKVDIIALNGKRYDGVQIKSEGVFIYGSTYKGQKHTVACLRTKSGDLVYMAVPMVQAEGLDLLDVARSLTDNVEYPAPYEGIQFPMVKLDIVNNIDWLLGMETRNQSGTPAVITQAIQQIRIRINEVGAHFESATAMAVTLKGIHIPKPELIIREPFIVWVIRPNVKEPIIAAVVTEENWENPGSLGGKEGDLHIQRG